MKKRITGYRKRIDHILEEHAEDTDWQAVLEEHLVQIGFFQHERLIHLLVTLAFAVFTILSVLVAVAFAAPILFVLTLAFLILLIPYIMHYYLLENETQKMYEQYDQILNNLRQHTHP